MRWAIPPVSTLIKTFAGAASAPLRIEAQSEPSAIIPDITNLRADIVTSNLLVSGPFYDRHPVLARLTRHRAKFHRSTANNLARFADEFT